MSFFARLRSLYKHSVRPSSRRRVNQRAGRKLHLEALEERTLLDGSGPTLPIIPGSSQTTTTTPGQQPTDPNGTGSGSGSFVDPDGGTIMGNQLAPTGNPVIDHYEGYVQRLYQDFLHRDPEPAGLAYWANGLATGMSRGSVAASLIQSAEFRSNIVRADYRGILSRDVDSGALTYWVSRLSAGMHEDALKPSLLASNEFYNKSGGNAQGWLNGVYELSLGRPLDPGALSWWTTSLQHGQSLSSVALAIAGSGEALVTTVAADYLTLLQRPVDAGGSLYWVGILQHGTMPSQLATMLASSDEYFQEQPAAATPIPGQASLSQLVDPLGHAPANGAFQSGNLTANGIGTPGTTVVVYVDGQATVTGSIPSSGHWSIPLPTPLVDGSHQIMAQAMDGSPVFKPGVEHTVIVETALPTITLQAPDFSTTASPVINVRVTPAGNNPIAATFRVDVDLNNDGSFRGPGETNYATGSIANGSGSITLPTLPPGTYTIQARVSDLAGNEGTSATVNTQINPNAGFLGSSQLTRLYQDYQDAVAASSTSANGAGPAVPPGTLPGSSGSTTGSPATVPSSFFTSRKSIFVFDDQSRVLLNVRSTLTKYVDGLRHDLESRGMKVTIVTPAQNMVTGYLPITEIMNLPTLANFAAATPSYAPIFKVGSVITQGDHILGADTLRNTTTLTGAGVTVGVISDSVDQFGGGLASSVATGDLPPTVNVLMDAGGGTDEGRAMLEIVHDVAPAAGLDFYTGSGGPQGFATAIVSLASAGAKSIVDDLGYPNDPFFNDGVVAQAVNQVTAGGAFYASATGNTGNQAFITPWVSGRTKISGVFGTYLDLGASLPPDLSNSGGRFLQPFTLAAGATMQIGVQWDSAFLEGGSPLPNYQVPNNVDVVITTPDGNQIYGTFNDVNQNTGEAMELVTFTNGLPVTAQFAMAFQLISGPAPTMLRWINMGGADPQALGEGASTVYGQPAARGATGVGAVDYLKPTDPEPYNDMGGAIPILFDANGNRLATPDLRMKPDVMGPDDVNTSFFVPGVDTEGDGFPNFQGTSAAAPHIAAVAALLLEQNPTLTPSQLRLQLIANAIDLGPLGFDAETGFGLVQAITTPPPSGPAVGTTSELLTGIEEIPNDTSNTAINYGLLALNDPFAVDSQAIVMHPNNLPDYDWYRWTMGNTGTFTVIPTAGQVSNTLELHLFTIVNGTLVELQNSSFPASTDPTLQTDVKPGQIILVEVKGNQFLPGQFGQGTYRLDVGLS